MDQTPDNFDEKKKNEIYGLLADYYLKAVEDRKIKEEERSSISSQIIASIDGARSLKDVLDFIDELSKKYTFFMPAALKLKGRLNIISEKDIINKLANYQ